MQRELDRAEDDLFVVLEDQGADLDDLPADPGPLEQKCLKLPESVHCAARPLYARAEPGALSSTPLG